MFQCFMGFDVTWITDSKSKLKHKEARMYFFFSSRVGQCDLAHISAFLAGCSVGPLRPLKGATYLNNLHSFICVI